LIEALAQKAIPVHGRIGYVSFPDFSLIISAIAGRPLSGRLLSSILQTQYIVYKL